MLNVEQILVPYDFSPTSDHALDQARDLAAATGAALHLVNVDVLHGPPYDAGGHPPTTPDEVRAQLRKRAEEMPELRVAYEVLRGVAAAPALLQYADEHDIDLVVMGTHGRRGVRRMLLGSVAAEVVQHASCPVLTVRQRDTTPSVEPGATILVPIDFSAHSRDALHHAVALAGLRDASLTLLHVVEETLHPAFYGPTLQSIYDANPDIEQQSIHRMKELYEEIDGAPAEVRFEARPGRASRVITQVAQEDGAELIVMATHGRTGLEHYLIGSVAEKVVRGAPCPVLTVRSFGKSLVGTREAQDGGALNAERSGTGTAD